MFRALVCCCLLACCLPAASARAADSALEPHNGGFFTLSKPRGWTVTTAGQCGSFAFVIRDPGDPLRMIFGFGEAGPVYVHPRQKQIDAQAMRMGATPITWADMPVVSPLTPANFLVQFHAVAGSAAARRFMPQCPRLERFQAVSSRRVAPMVQGGVTELVRGVFVQNGRAAEGLFLATVAPLMPVTGAPGAGNAMGLLIYGIAAPRGEFARLEQTLTASLKSFSMDQRYVQQCMARSNQRWTGVRRAGQTLRETSDIITRGWAARSRTEDIIAQKRSDAILGQDRVYDPATGEVYSVSPGFYDAYDRNRQKFDMSSLKRLPPDDHGLWTAPVRDGSRIH
jgi:hypothetical protein